MAKGRAEATASRKGGPEPSKGLVEVLGQALVDADYRKRLVADPAKVADEAGLSDLDRDALRQVNQAQLEDAAARLGTHSEFKIMIGIAGHFKVSE